MNLGGGVVFVPPLPMYLQSIISIVIQLIWHKKHPNLFNLVVVTCESWCHMTHLTMSAILVLPSWISNILQNCFKKSEKNIKNARTVKILELYLYKIQNLDTFWKHACHRKATWPFNNWHTKMFLDKFQEKTQSLTFLACAV